MLSKCCCCVPLRTGSLVIAVLGILGALGILASSKGQWPSIVEGIFFLLPYAFLLFGAIKYNDKAVLVCVVLTALSIIIGIVFGIIAIVKIEIINPLLANDCEAFDYASDFTFFLDCDKEKFKARAITAAYLFVLSLVEVYFWICNFSFYKELKKGGGEAAV